MTTATYTLTTITEPDVEVVEIAHLKDHARIDGSDHDDSLARKVTAARRLCEAWCGRAFVTQTLEYAQDGGIDGYELYLPRKPLQSVSSFSYYSTADVLGTLSTSAYIVDTSASRIFLADGWTWPTDLRGHRSIVVQYVAGYSSDPDEVPDNLREAVLKLAAWMHEHPDSYFDGGTGSRIPDDVKQLLAVDCVDWV